VMSLGCNSDALYAWREEQRQGRMGGADIFTADRGLGVTGGAPPFPIPGQIYRPANPDEARAAVREMAARHPDLLKLWLDDLFGSAPKMEPEIYKAAVAEAHAAIDEAHRHGFRMAAHVFYLGDAKALLAAGVDVIAHSVRDQPVDEEFISAMKARHVPYVATLSLDESQFIYAEHPAWMDTPFFIAAVAPELLAKWRTPEYAEKMRANPATAKNKAAFAMGLRNVKALREAGVTLSFGTDSGAMPTRLAGFGEHRELQLLVEAGLTPMEAIVCATHNAAETIGDGEHRGTLTTGKRADFVVLGANPLDDIHNTTKIEAIWHGGRKVSPAVPLVIAASGGNLKTK
jgi:imidazolonepropionase-like amidohydrolase